MYGFAISEPNVTKKFIAGGNKIYNPKIKPKANVRYIIGILVYKQIFSLLFKPGLKNIINWENTIGDDINNAV